MNHEQAYGSFRLEACEACLKLRRILLRGISRLIGDCTEHGQDTEDTRQERNQHNITLFHLACDMRGRKAYVYSTSDSKDQSRQNKQRHAHVCIYICMYTHS